MLTEITQQPSAAHSVDQADRKMTTAEVLLDRAIDVLDQREPDVDHAVALVAMAVEELEQLDAVQ